MTSSTSTQEFTFTSQYALTGQQKASIAIAAALPAVLTVFFATQSGKAAWWLLLAAAPLAGWLVWWEDRRRKTAAGVTVAIRDGMLTCRTRVKADMEQTGVGVPVDAVTAISYGEPHNRKIVFVVAETEDNQDNPTVRIPVRAFTPGNPVGPALLAIAAERGIEVSAVAREYLSR